MTDEKWKLLLVLPKQRNVKEINFSYVFRLLAILLLVCLLSASVYALLGLIIEWLMI